MDHGSASQCPAFAPLPQGIQRHQAVARAELFICGLGCMEVHVNGALADDSVLEPGWTLYSKTCLYRVYDLTNRLAGGENVLGVMLGNGMYNVKGGRYTKFTGSFGPPKLIAQLHLDYTDGTGEVVVSDPSWLTAPGPIAFACVYGGEDYDARLEIAHWDKPGFPVAADSGGGCGHRWTWRKACLLDSSRPARESDQAIARGQQNPAQAGCLGLRSGTELFHATEDHSPGHGGLQDHHTHRRAVRARRIHRRMR